MSFDPNLASIRFGYGLGLAEGPDSVPQMLSRLKAPDVQAARYPIPGLLDVVEDVFWVRQANSDRYAARKNGDDIRARELTDDIKAFRKAQNAKRANWFAHTMTRAAFSEDAFKERLVRFWADHFTVRAKGVLFQGFGACFTEDAIRPNIGGPFADLLKASVLHPLMLSYLDQFASAGENSALALEGKRSLNENLAREILELHTIGVDGRYTQDDVRSFANLLAGVTFNKKGRVGFNKRKANPGPETVLGVTYGDDVPKISDIRAALNDLAVHPDTARHIARKLATHFISDTPDPALIDEISDVFLSTDGDLSACYEALLSHPTAWAPTLQKAKQPFDFLASSLRALHIEPAALLAHKRGLRYRTLLGPLNLMGQAWERPPGPDGWPEDAEHWITPQGLAMRIQWSMSSPAALMTRLPDPRRFVRNALGPFASKETRFAARAAETRREGIGIILASPEFQRR